MTIFFRFSKNDVNTWIINGIDIAKANIHVWITLQSGEILDLTFPTSYGHVRKIPKLLGLIVNGHEEELEGFDYFPMGIGTDFLRAIGAIT